MVFDGAPVEITGLSVRRCMRLAGRVLLVMVLTLGQPCGVWNPGGVCLLATAGGGAEGLAVLAGVWAGAFGAWGFAGGLEAAAAAIMIFAGAYLQEGTALAARRWFAPALCSGMTALAGLMALTAGFSSGAMLRWAGLVAAAFWGSCCFQAFAANRSVKTSLVPVALLILGLNTIPLPGGMTVGSILATALSLASAAMGGTCALAVACGLGLDLARSSGGAMTAMLAFGALFVLVVRRRPRGLRPTVFAVACTAGSLLWANGDSTLVVGLPLALLLAAPLCLLPGRPRNGRRIPKSGCAASWSRLPSRWNGFSPCSLQGGGNGRPGKSTCCSTTLPPRSAATAASGAAAGGITARKHTSF